MTDRILIALGGNALVRPDDSGTFDQQVSNARAIADYVAKATAEGTQIVLSHGNGPQVGNILLQNDDIEEATKPVGPFYTESEAQQRQSEDGVVFREDAGRGWRRMVPSPEPKEIRCSPQVQRILADGNVPIVAGGGGLPMTSGDDGYRYVNGVVDKDLAAAQLAIELDVDRLVILTDVSHVWLNYGQEDAKRLERVDASTAREYQTADHFGRGSMYEKVEAVCRYLEATDGTEGVIASLDECGAAIDGETGTRFEQSRPHTGNGA